MPPTPSTLQSTVVEIEQHVAASGWDQRPVLFALVPTEDLLAREPALAAQLGMTRDTVVPGSLTPIEQEGLGDPLDEALARIMWPDEVLGCALVQEVVVLPPEAEEQRPPDADPATYAADHPDRRDVRLAVGVLRDGSQATALRVRDEEEILVGDNIAPNLAEALLATLQ